MQDEPSTGVPTIDEIEQHLMPGYTVLEFRKTYDEQRELPPDGYDLCYEGNAIACTRQVPVGEFKGFWTGPVIGRRLQRFTNPLDALIELMEDHYGEPRDS